MVNIIILEGIPTAGKSQTINNLIKFLKEKNKSFVFIDDHEIAKLIFERNDITNRDPVDGVEDHILDVLKKRFEDVDFIIMHNAHIFYMALNAHRGKLESIVSDYSKIEEFFSKHNTLIVFLRIPKERIYSHYMFSINKRKELNPNSRTDKFWSMKGSNDDERIQYYENKQLTYERLLKETRLNNVTYLIEGGIEIYPEFAKKILKYFRIDV